MSSSTPVIRTIVAAYESQVSTIEQMLESYASDLATLRSNQEKLEYRLYGQILIIELAMKAEDCYHSYDYVGSKTSTGRSPARYNDRMIVGMSDPEFKGWRRRYHLVD